MVIVCPLCGAPHGIGIWDTDACEVHVQRDENENVARIYVTTVGIQHELIHTCDPADDPGNQIPWRTQAENPRWFVSHLQGDSYPHVHTRIHAYLAALGAFASDAVRRGESNDSEQLRALEAALRDAVDMVDPQ